jgi:chromosome partitioning protein
MKIIAIANQKGGVGKTTCAVNISSGISNLDKKVLVIDLDPQAHLTISLGFSKNLEHNLYTLLGNQSTIENTIINRGNLDIIPSSEKMVRAELDLSTEPGGEYVLREIIGNSINNYEYIFLDCPPNLLYLTLNALTLSTHVYIPLQTEFLPMDGMKTLISTINTIQKRLNPKLEIGGIICTQYVKNRISHRESLKTIEENFGDLVFKTKIRQNTHLSEAPSFGKSIFEYDEKSNGAKDYHSLCKEIVERN